MTATDDRKAIWCQSAQAKGEAVMEKAARNNEPQDDARKQAAEDLAHLLDSIETEVFDMADPVLPEGSLRENMSYSDDDETAELDPEPFFEEQDLQLDIETAEDSAKPSTEIQAQEQAAKIEKGAQVENKDEVEKMPVEKEKLNVDTEEAETTGEENASAPIMSNKISADVDRIVEEKISAITQQPFKNSSGNREPESELEGKVEAASQKLDADFFNDELVNLMNSRIEKIVIRTLEERMPAMIERSILEAIKKILLSI